MSKRLAPSQDSSPSEDSVEQCPPINKSRRALFNARLVTARESGEADRGFDNYQQLVLLGELLTEVQHTYDQNRANFIADVRLRETIEHYVKYARAICQYSQTFLRLIEEIAFDFLSSRESFRNFTGSRAFRRACRDLLEQQLDAKRCLQESRLIMHSKLSNQVFVEDYLAVGQYMATVVTYFDAEYKRYAPIIFTPEATNEDICKLRGMVTCMSFDGVRSLGRLFGHGQYVRRQLEACESVFLGVWWDLSTEDIGRASWDLEFLRAASHSTRHHIMLLAAIAMQFVRDDEDDRFIAFCRMQEDRISYMADNLYAMQERIKQLMEKLKSFPPDVEVENKPGSLAADPVEMSMFQAYPKLVRGGYNAFLAHDGSEDSVRLARNLQLEIQKRMISCYMEGGKELEYGVPMMSDATERTLDDCCVGVFLLTPEFAKKKLKVAQLRHILRRVCEARVGWPGPTLIPVFYKVSVRECRDGNIFEETEEDVDVDVLKKVFDEITRYTGIENLEGATEGDSKAMQERRYGLVERAANAVAEACLTTVKKSKEELRVVRNEDVDDEHKKYVEGIRQEITKYRRWQREARERASLF